MFFYRVEDKTLVPDLEEGREKSFNEQLNHDGSLVPSYLYRKEDRIMNLPQRFECL